MKKYITVVLLLAIVAVVPSSASASSLGGIQAQINQLFLQLEILQTQLENIIEEQSRLGFLRAGRTSRLERPDRSSRTKEATITVIAPNGGETWYFGEEQNIEWTTTGGIEEVVVYLHFPAGATCKLAVVENTGSYSTAVYDGQDCPGIETIVTSGDYKMLLYGMGRRIDDHEATAPHDSSDNFFTLDVRN